MDDEHEKFWQELDAYTATFGHDTLLFIGGDLNGHVGWTRDGFKHVHGGCGYVSRNIEGERILEYAEAFELIIANTFFRKRPSNLITYSSGGNNTQIDYWLARRKQNKLNSRCQSVPHATSPLNTSSWFSIFDVIFVHLGGLSLRLSGLNGGISQEK